MIDLVDPLALIFFLFRDTDPPPAPFPACGDDPTPDAHPCELECAS